MTNACNPWISVVFIQGECADEILDTIDIMGPAAALIDLLLYDYGDETTLAAVANGYVADELPTRVNEYQYACGRFVMIYNYRLSYVTLYRRHHTDIH